MKIRFYNDPATGEPHIYNHGITEEEAEVTPERETMSQNKFPPGWDEERVKALLTHYEEQSEEEAIAEDEASYEEPHQTVMEVPTILVPVIRELIAKHQA